MTKEEYNDALCREKHKNIDGDTAVAEFIMGASYGLFIIMLIN